MRNTRQPREKASERRSSSSPLSVRLSVSQTPALRTFWSTEVGVSAATSRVVMETSGAWSPYSRSAAVRSEMLPLLPTIGNAVVSP